MPRYIVAVDFFVIAGDEEEAEAQVMDGVSADLASNYHTNYVDYDGEV